VRLANENAKCIKEKQKSRQFMSECVKLVQSLGEAAFARCHARRNGFGRPFDVAIY
jgi:hypothetical protein